MMLSTNKQVKLTLRVKKLLGPFKFLEIWRLIDECWGTTLCWPTTTQSSFNESHIMNIRLITHYKYDAQSLFLNHKCLTNFAIKKLLIDEACCLKFLVCSSYIATNLFGSYNVDIPSEKDVWRKRWTSKMGLRGSFWVAKPTTIRAMSFVGVSFAKWAILIGGERKTYVILLSSSWQRWEFCYVFFAI